MLRKALAENRLIHHIQPVVKLPQRRPAGYDLVPRLKLEDGDLANAPDFMPRRGGRDVVVQIESSGLVEAVTIGRRARAGGQQVTLYIPLSRATLSDPPALEQLLAILDANRAIASGLVFKVPDAEWRGMTTPERSTVQAIARKGAGFSLSDMESLRIDVADLAALGVRSVRVDATAFLSAPERYTDFHVTDIAAYLARFEVALMATGITGERQIVEFIDSDILLVQGDYVAAPGPVRSDLGFEPMRSVGAQLRRAES
nr:EAL domain-containing protein [Devosia oryzisoli]